MHFILTKKSQKQSTWSGGITTELWIHPKNAQYLNRDFHIRISTATIQAEESVFSDLRGYTRHLMSLDHPITLSHSEQKSFTLEPMMPYTFDGSIPTRSNGTAQDFNIMVKSPYTATLKSILMQEGESLVLQGHCVGIYCFSGAVVLTHKNVHTNIQSGDFLLEENPRSLKISAECASVIIVSTLYL